MSGELLSLPTYRKQHFAFPFALDAALDAAVAHADAQARALGKRAAGWKAGGPAMTRVCNCTPRALLAAARARHGATLVYLHRRDATAVALSLEMARRSGVYVLSAAAAPAAAAPAAAAPAAAAAAPASAAPATTSSAASASVAGRAPQLQPPPINLSSVAGFVRKAQDLAAHAERVRAMLQRHLRPFLSVAYEDLYPEPSQQIGRIFRHLGVPACAVAAGRATTRKIAGTSFRGSVLNWRELCDALDAAGLRTAAWHATCVDGEHGNATLKNGTQNRSASEIPWA